MSSNLKSKLQDVGRSLAELTARIEDINSELEDAHERRHAVAIAPPTRQETVEKLTALVDRGTTRYAYKFRGQVYGTFRAQLDLSKSDPLPGTHDFFSRRTFEGDSVDHDALYFFFGDLLKEKIHAEIESMEWLGSEGLSAGERAKELAKLDEEIESLEGQKAELFGEMRAAGVHVSERDVVPPEDDSVTTIRPSPPPTVGTIAEPETGKPPGELEQVAADLRAEE